MSAGTPTEAPGKIRATREDDGRLLRLELASPPTNILDLRTISALREVLASARDEPGLRAIVLTHEGPNFSYGASVEEHLPGRFQELIPGFHGLLRAMLGLDLPILAAVSGYVLGAGLEVVSMAHRIFASGSALLGQPEIKLGVFAPAASAALPSRVGQAHADDLLLSGRNATAEEALRIGLVDVLADFPAEAAAAYARDNFYAKSATSLRLAARAARSGFRRVFLAALEEVESLYARDLMATPDAVEGLKAFLGKRKPEWRSA